MAMSATVSSADITTPDSILLDVREVAALLRVSPRTVYRMSDAGAMPRPRKLNALSRYSRQEIVEWISSGCPMCRDRKAGR